MTKQEYEAQNEHLSMIIITAFDSLAVVEAMEEQEQLRLEYIESLEAENEQLQKDNVSLIRQINNCR